MYRQAIEDFDRAVELNPGFALAYYNRGGAYMDLKDHRQALRDFEAAVEINPGYAEAYDNMGYVYMTLLGGGEMACEYWKKACGLGLCGNYDLAVGRGLCD